MFFLSACKLHFGTCLLAVFASIKMLDRKENCFLWIGHISCYLSSHSVWSRSCSQQSDGHCTTGCSKCSPGCRSLLAHGWQPGAVQCVPFLLTSSVLCDRCEAYYCTRYVSFSISRIAKQMLSNGKWCNT